MLQRLFAVTVFAFAFACGGGMPASSTGGLHGATESCKSSADCQTGLTCATEDPNGQCIKLCTPSMDATCGDPTLACSFEGHCYKKCNTTADCTRASEGYVCKNDMPARGVKFCDVGP